MTLPNARPTLKIFFDGGCRPNPGRMEAAVVLRGQTHLFEDLGTGTSADAEWQALICAVKVAQAGGLTNFTLMGDAIDVIRKANTALRTGQGKNGHAAALLELAAGASVPRIRWIKRSQNLAGIALAARHPR